ncbi:virion structural protein [Pseudomonas phage phi15]|uniref:Virion structural protein n=1 Tax=Pseudomonas phage phi15 TaxID=988656 RepID=F0V6X6_9CAUD|nr:virion structural protein [Pseudomonas phage phi15]CBZ41988.1 virion structural protein [Pseudomonas phage phi15]
MSKTILLLGLTSTRGRSGKDTLIEELTKQGHVVHRVAFGDVLKEQAAIAMANPEVFSSEELLEFFHTDAKDHEMPGLTIDNLPEGDYKSFLLANGHEPHALRTPRWHLQQYGTEYRRVHLGNPNVWLNEGLKKIKEVPMGTTVVVVTDLRQRNEYIALSNLNEQGFMARLVRIQRMWFVEGVDDAEFHQTDLDLIGFYMNAVVLNEWGQQAAMVTQLREQGVDV